MHSAFPHSAVALHWQAAAYLVPWLTVGHGAVGVSRFYVVALNDTETSLESILLAALATGWFLADVAYQEMLAVMRSRRNHVPSN